MTLFAEDLRVGAEAHLGSYLVTREELISFAQKWDPQSFHIDAEAASRGYFGDLIASGAHTMAIYQRLSVLSDERTWAVIAGVRLAEVRFLAPVRPGSLLTASSRIEAIEFARERSRALVTKRGWLRDSGVPVLELTSDAYVSMRAAPVS